MVMSTASWTTVPDSFPADLGELGQAFEVLRDALVSALLVHPDVLVMEYDGSAARVCTDGPARHARIAGELWTGTRVIGAEEDVRDVRADLLGVPRGRAVLEGGTGVTVGFLWPLRYQLRNTGKQLDPNDDLQVYIGEDSFSVQGDSPNWI